MNREICAVKTTIFEIEKDANRIDNTTVVSTNNAIAFRKDRWPLAHEHAFLII